MQINKLGRTQARRLGRVTLPESNHLVIHAPEHPTRQDERSASIIDLFITTQEIKRFGHPFLKTIPFDSDHNVVEFTMSLDSIVCFLHNKSFYDWQAADIDSIKEKVKDFVKENPIPINRNLNVEEIDDIVEKFTCSMGNAIINHVPTRKKTRGHSGRSNERLLCSEEKMEKRIVFPSPKNFQRSRINGLSQATIERH